MKILVTLNYGITVSAGFGQFKDYKLPFQRLVYKPTEEEAVKQVRKQAEATHPFNKMRLLNTDTKIL